MRRLCLLPLALLASHAFAGNRYQSKRYQGQYPLYRAQRPGSWIRNSKKPIFRCLPCPMLQPIGFLYVSCDFLQRALIDLNSITPAPDDTICYTLAVQSANGMDNLTSEALYCAPLPFSLSDKEKRSSYKVFGYGDTVNNRWITPRNAKWQPIGAILTASPSTRLCSTAASAKTARPAPARNW